MDKLIYMSILQPPKLCEFQSSSYVLSYAAGNKLLSREPVPILDTGSD